MPPSFDHKSPNTDRNPRDHELSLAFLGAVDGSDQKAIDKVIDLTLRGARLNLPSFPNSPQIKVGSELYELQQACRLAGYNGKVNDVSEAYQPNHQLMVTFQSAKLLSEKFLQAKKAGDDLSENSNVKANAKAIERDVIHMIAKLKFFMELGGRLDLASPIKCPDLSYDSPFIGLLSDCKLAAYSSAKKTQPFLVKIIARANDAGHFANLRLHDHRIYRCIPAKELANAVKDCFATLIKQNEFNVTNNASLFLELLQQKKVLFLPEIAEQVCRAIIKIVKNLIKSDKKNIFLQSLADKGILSILADDKIDNLSLRAHLAKIDVKVDVFIVRAGDKKLHQLEKFRAKRKPPQIPPQQTAEQIRYFQHLDEEIQLHFGIEGTKKSAVPNAAASKANGSAGDVKHTTAAAPSPAEPVSGSSAAIHERLIVSEKPKVQPSVRRSSIVAGGKVLVMKADAEPKEVKGAANEQPKPPRHVRSVTGRFGVMPLAAWEQYPPKSIDKTKPHPLAVAPPKFVYGGRPATPANAIKHGRRCTMW